MGVGELALLLKWGLDKPLFRLATSANRALVALAGDEVGALFVFQGPSERGRFEVAYLPA